MNLIAPSICNERALPSTGKDTSRTPSVVPSQMATSNVSTAPLAPSPNSPRQDNPVTNSQDSFEADLLDETDSFTYGSLENTEERDFDQHLQSVVSALSSRGPSTAVEEDKIEPAPSTLVPASAHTHEDVQHTETPIEPVRASWDNGEEITAEEREALLEMRSDAERARAMNIRRRDRVQFSNGLIDSIPPIVSKIPPAVEKSKKKKKMESIKKGNVSVSDADVRSKNDRSTRKKPQAPPPTSSPHATPLLALQPNPSTTEDRQGPDFPEWMIAAMPCLQGLSGDPQWTSLLEKWVCLERQLGFPKGRVSLFSFFLCTT